MFKSSSLREFSYFLCTLWLRTKQTKKKYFFSCIKVFEVFEVHRGFFGNLRVFCFFTESFNFFFRHSMRCGASIAEHAVQRIQRHIEVKKLGIWRRATSTYSTWTAHWPQKCNRGNRKRGQSVKTFCPFLSFFYWLKGFSMKGVQDCNTQNKNHGKVCKYLVL